jgi:LysR family transcriptional regulator, hydrogen peroxide-inducible genes activator
MNLNQLHFAHAVAATSSFTLAAAQCNVTQPTLSNGIAQLEDELGERLFVRTTRKVALTPFGMHTLPYIAQVIGAQHTLVHQVQAFLKPDKQLIRIGTSPLVNTTLLTLMVEPFRRQHPSVDVVLREMNMADLNRMLQDGLLDFVFGVAQPHKGAVACTPLYSEPLLYVPRGNHPAAKRSTQSVQLKDIADETYVMVPDACGLSQATRALFRSQRRILHAYSGEAMSYQVLAEWAALGIGAAILPQSKLRDGGHGALFITDKADQTINIGFEAVWLRPNKQAMRAAHLVRFAEHLQKTVPGLIKGLNQSLAQ